MLNKFKKYIQDVKKELKKVSWSDRRMVWNSTILVLILSGVSAVYIGLVDLLFSTILSNILK
ncbi:MAG: preprotein translocase subunit SecE [Candidatus Omnitrophica bacterium]|nr:preprotein translocase subunit SecE [Candidatus Omnitrophota bacterium]MBU1047012.1 preprotein translocase subunit SecE [Candidatus Omnitrophota bacterium]MBU1631357.1 preprotein translocase subunit SecE [Candidatus Omnitrophota bacterium]MBU1767317.1 preprotein translocase subunit SecE [Candidatus Omnitrophota bacterium]MBU1889622.1 preprotein translocase subunit SecE [Candidatus Omnitrophota bacterium]